MISFPSKSVYTLYNPVESSVEDFEVRMNEECDEKNTKYEKMDEDERSG